jgi:O-6-methylguanine DNA methyltransferase
MSLSCRASSRSISWFRALAHTELGEISIAGFEGCISQLEFTASFAQSMITGEAPQSAIFSRICEDFDGSTSAQIHDSWQVKTTHPNSSTIHRTREIEALVRNVVAVVNGRMEASAIAIRMEGTPFQHKVWDFLQSIPGGSTRAYAEIARAVGAPQAYRAVANACGANRLSILIPCHRAVRSDGSLGGYRWGLERKRALLERETVRGISDASLGRPADNTEGQQ